MKNRYGLLFALVFSLTLQRAAAGGPIELVSMGFTNAEGKTENFTYAVEPAHAAKLPAWTPSDSVPPPLEFEQALKIVRGKIDKSLPSKWNWGFQNIRLTRGPKQDWKTICYYEFDLMIFPLGADGGNGRLWPVIVLLDGTILAPDPFK